MTPNLTTLAEQLHHALKQWHGADLQRSPLDNRYLFRQAQQTHALDAAAATRHVLSEALDQLAQQDAEAAELLRLRFVDEEPAHIVARRLDFAEGTVYKKQREEIQQLAEIVQRMETALLIDRRAEWEARLQPSTYSALFGVDDHLDELAAQIVQPQPPWVVAVEGIGGIGKTALADALTRRLLHGGQIGGSFADVAWVTARQSLLNAGGGLTGGLRHVERPVLTVDELTYALLDQLLPADERPVAQTPDALRNQLSQRLRATPHLVVIDNLETVADVQGLLDALRGWAGPSKFLLTTRHSLLHEADVFPCRVPELGAAHAIQLIRREATLRNRPALARASDDELRPIVKTVGGNPLALRLVVGQTHIHALDTILADLREAQGATASYLYTYIYERAWRNLDEAGRRLLLLMPLVNGEGADLDYLAAASGYTPATLRQGLDRLVTLNLVDRRGDLHAARYTIHSLTRTFLHRQVLEWTKIED